ncbi:MAG: thiosulfate oxidation carrier protein SoxY [Gammaproteobacteria bacterium]|nr:thiosulfate oxidation carrier protein SoxY [Gammaproteobacteria bacterium]
MKRRVFLKGTLASSAFAVAVGAGLLSPRQVLAAWPKSAFQAKNVNDALKNLYNSDLAPASDAIKLEAPDIAENGAVVPVTIETSLKNVESITIISEKNQTPLVASFNMTPKAEGYISTRIKMGQTSNVIAVVKANGKLHSTRKEVKVTIGGCGG